MLQVIGGAAISAAMIVLALGLIATEFRKRWPQVIAAFAMPDLSQPAFDPSPLSFRPRAVVARRRLPARASASPAYRLAA